MAQKAKKKSKLRHAEYYDMQKTFDSLYADSKSGEVFGHLMDIISAPSNIKLAFRNIKGNDGSHTAGTDGRTIESLAVMPEDKFVKLIQKQFRRYEPKAVKRVEIPKPNGKMRPLGIPCIIDRIVQQCILQVMEPICEAKFYEHSYGFRPCRSAENAISYAYGLAQRNKLHYVVDVDVKGFFDMRMRDVSPSLASFLAHPGMTVECIYVPLLMAASKAADDLSVASVTRGIENPNPRTCLVQIKCGAADWGVMAVAVAYLIFELCVRGGVIG